MTDKTLALSLRHPWPFAILECGKDIENRIWPTRVRGRVYIHASNWWNEKIVREDLEDLLDIAQYDPETINQKIALLLPIMKMQCGHLVGSVEITGCWTGSDSPWFDGPFGFSLANPVPLVSAIRCRGALYFFDVPADVLAQSTTR